MPQQPPNPDPGARPAALRGSSHRFPYKLWLVAIVFDAFFVFLVYFDRDADLQWYVEDWIKWGLIGMLALPGLLVTGLSLFDTVRFARYSVLRLELHPLPATAGSLMAGVLNVPVPYDPAHRYAVRLEAIEHRPGTSAGHTMPRVKYQEDFEVRAAPGTQGTQLRFDLRMPAGAPPSQGYGETMRWTPATQKRVYLRWTLRIFARNPGVDLKEEFEIPVRRATAAEAAFAPASPPTARAPALPPMPSGIPSYVTAQVGERWVIRQPPWRKPGSRPSHVFGGMAFFGLFFFFGFLLVGSGLTYLHHWAPSVVGGLFVVIGIFFARHVLVSAASELRVEVSRFDGLLINRSVWGLRLKHVVLDRARIATVEVLGGPPSWSVEVREHSGTVHCVAESIRTAREAEALRDQVIARLGLVASAEAGQAARAAAAAAERQFQRRGSVATTAILLGSVGLLAAAYLLVPDWYVVKAPAQLATQVATPSVPQTAPPPPSGVDRALWLASRAESTGSRGRTGSTRSGEGGGNVNAAIGHLVTAIRVAREENGEAHPLEAYVLYKLAQAQRRAHAPGGAKESLDAAMRIMERHRPADARRMLGAYAGHFDLEVLANYGGRMLWEERRYAQAHVYYLKAREAALEVEVSDGERNLRRGTASAGVMVTACMLGNWELADKAMAELLEHYRRAPPNANGAMKYLIDTGEPRLKARKC